MIYKVKSSHKNKSHPAPPKQKKTEKMNTVKTVEPSYLPNRFIIFWIIVILLVIALIYKAVSVQVIESSRLISEAKDRSQRTIYLPFKRGNILDRNGKILSISAPMYSIEISPSEYFSTRIKRNKESIRLLAREASDSESRISKNMNNFIKKKNRPAEKVIFDPRSIQNPKDPKYWELLSEIFDIPLIQLEAIKTNPYSNFIQLENEAERLEQEKWRSIAKVLNINYNVLMDNLYKKYNKGTYNLASQQTEEVMNYIKELKMPAVSILESPRRFYPIAEEASQLIGFSNVYELRDEKKKKEIIEKGAEGLERSFDSLLVGKKGRQIILKDKKGNIIQNISHQKQYNPQDVVLSIDQDLQSMIYREIKNAVAENNAESATAVLVDVQTGEILAMANAPSFNPNNRSDLKPELIRNRAITDTFEPGSTVKPFTVLTALQNGVTYRDEVINTHPFVVNGHTIRDVAPRDSLSITGILQKSSNIGVSRLALRMPSTALVDTYSKIGFGKDTGLGLGEQRGTNGDRKRWSDIERATLAYGYGLNVTPLQLARAYATLGSFGIYRPLSITKVDPPVIGERVLPEKITRDVVHMMESVAQKGEGGQKAMVEGYRVAVKTGTARKLEKGQYVEKYLAYTAGLAPASNPRFALVVLMNEPKAGNYYGGAVSAPLFSKIMGYTLKAYNIKPDNLIE